jgi:hypothetical protein
MTYNNDWKPTENNISSPWGVNVQENNIGEPLKTGVVDYSKYYEPFQLQLTKQSNWKCYLFGNRPGGNGIIYVPAEGRVPNRFVRFMMRICFDSVWVKEK